MNLQFYVEKLKDSESYKKFIKENPEAFLCSGFFIIDKEGSDNKSHFDFCTKDKNIFSIQLEDDKLVPVEVIDKSKIEKVSLDIDFDFKDVEKLVVDKIEEEGIKSKLQKMLFSLQRMDEGDFLVGTVFVSGLGMLKVLIDLKDMKIVEFEKKSFFDMLKISGKKKKD